jgi:hypothetical protein
VCVDTDASEKGLTGGVRRSDEGRRRQDAMKSDWESVEKQFQGLGVCIGGRKRWCKDRGMHIKGDIDVIAVGGERCVLAEVEGASSGQPEQKLYKAIGQMVRTAGRLPEGWSTNGNRLVIVVYGDRIAEHLKQAHALAELGISGLALAHHNGKDCWLFGKGLALSR